MFGHESTGTRAHRGALSRVEIEHFVDRIGQDIESIDRKDSARNAVLDKIGLSAGVGR